MKKKLLSVMMATTLSFTMLVGCASSDSKKEDEAVSENSDDAASKASDEADTAASNAQEESSEEETAAVEAIVLSEAPATDLAGNENTVPTEIDAIVSMSPSSTRLLIDLGLSDYIVACDTYSYEYYGDDLVADVPQYDTFPDPVAHHNPSPVNA